MRFLTVLTGAILAAAGVMAIANSGLTFLSVAFIVGVVLLFVGLVECFSYKSTKQDEDDKYWLLIEGITTFILGVVVLTGQLAADVAVPVVFGMWIMISGIRVLVLVLRTVYEDGSKDGNFYWELCVGALNTLVGLYTFFNSVMFRFPVLMILGICFILQAANLLKIGLGIAARKPEIIKTKEEKVAEAEEVAAKAHEAAREAIKAAKEAKGAVKEAEESKEFHEIIQEPVVVDDEIVG